MSKWYDENGPESDVVVSSRIRLARNFSDYKFASRIEEEDAKALVNSVIGCFQKDFTDGYTYYFMNNTNENKRNALKEKRVISSYLVGNKLGAAILSEDEGTSVLVNAEDHIRIQALCEGMDLQKCYAKADTLDDYFDAHFDYAFDEKYGYKTSFPTNIGTGLRAGYTLHLPGICEARKLSQISTELARFGLNIKPVYGDNETVYGNLYQVSNQKSLGHTEQDIIKDLDEIVTQLINQERGLRNAHYEKDRYLAEDMAYKSYGVLKYARKISLKDAMTLLSELMLGVSLNIISTVSDEKIAFNRLLMEIQPAVLNNAVAKSMSVDDVDVLRAQYIRNNLPEIH